MSQSCPELQKQLRLASCGPFASRGEAVSGSTPPARWGRNELESPEQETSPLKTVPSYLGSTPGQARRTSHAPELTGVTGGGHCREDTAGTHRISPFFSHVKWKVLLTAHTQN